MPRSPNPFQYQDPMPEITSNLARAIFGDPAARAQQQQRQAEMDERRAHTRLYNNQADGQLNQNTASQGLPTLIAKLYPEQAAPIPSLADPAFLDGAGPTPPPVDPTAVFRDNIGAVIAGLGQAQGDKVDTSQTVGALASFLGGDELARRGMVAQGHSPTADFSITPERADVIAANDAAAKQRSAFGVASINHASDIPVANIQAGSAARVAGINHASDIPIANIQASTSRDVADIKEGGDGNRQTRGMRNNNPGNLEFGSFARSLGATGSDGRFAIFPTFEAGVAAQERLLGGGSYFGAGLNTIDKVIGRYAPASENSVSNYGNYVSRVTGIPRNQPITQDQIPAVAAAMRQFENSGAGGGGSTFRRTSAAAKPLSSENQNLLNAAVDEVLKANGLEIDKSTKDFKAPRMAATARAYLNEQAAALFWQAGSAPAAARMAWEKMQRDAAATRAARNTPGRHLTPAEAQRLPAGSKFTGQDGVERVKNGGWGKARVIDFNDLP